MSELLLLSVSVSALLLVRPFGSPIFGPNSLLLGAYFASRPLPPAFNSWGVELNVYAVPAILTLVLLVLETLFLMVALPETRGTNAHTVAKEKTQSTVKKFSAAPAVKSTEKAPITAHVSTVQERLDMLKVLRRLHFLFLGVFSGMEFTLTFLTFDCTCSPFFVAIVADALTVLDWNNKQNGALIGSIGVISAFIQGGYVRRAKHRVQAGAGVPAMARHGVLSCALGLVFLAVLPQLIGTHTTTAVRLLQGAAVCLAFTSATVVNSLTSYASLQCDEGVDQDTAKPVTEHPQLAKGKALGEFRSSGQLGRALGPLLGMSLQSLLVDDSMLILYSLKHVHHTGRSDRPSRMPSGQQLCYRWGSA